MLSGQPRAGESLDFTLLNALLARGLEFVAWDPACQRRQPRRLGAQRKAELRDDRVARKIHLRFVLVARLVIAMFRVVFGLGFAPLRGMACELNALIDRKRGHARARQTKMIRAVIMSSLRPRTGPHRPPKLPPLPLPTRVKVD